jgi:hypothetical protein
MSLKWKFSDMHDALYVSGHTLGSGHGGQVEFPTLITFKIPTPVALRNPATRIINTSPMVMLNPISDCVPQKSSLQATMSPPVVKLVRVVSNPV